MGDESESHAHGWTQLADDFIHLMLDPVSYPHVFDVVPESHVLRKPIQIVVASSGVKTTYESDI